jgi:predicted RNA-binding protein with PUA-like domain
VARWLVKEEPEHYSWADLVRDGRTEWDGVHNALALRHLRAMREGDEAIFYHTGDERACVGVIRILSAPHPDPKDERGSWSVAVGPVRPLARSIPLSELKGDRGFDGFDLVRVGRLSVLPVSDAHWTRLMVRERKAPAAGSATAGAARPARGTARRPKRRAARRKR